MEGMCVKTHLELKKKGLKIKPTVRMQSKYLRSPIVTSPAGL